MFSKFRHLVGIPFVDGVSDCWMIVKMGYEAFGIKLPDYNFACNAVEAVGYDPEGIGSVVAQMAKSQIDEWKQLEEPEEPCIVAMSLGVPGFFHHLALYIGRGRILHTRRETLSAIESLGSLLYVKREKAFYKYVG